MEKHIYWEGEIVHKKKKMPAVRHPSCISSPNFRIYHEEQAEKKLREKTEKKLQKKSLKKSTKETTKCPICCILFRNDEGEEVWIECEMCSTWMHLKCLSAGHRRAMGLVLDGDNTDIDFFCEDCYSPL